MILPPEIKYHKNGKSVTYRDENGKVHRDNDPAITTYRKNGIVWSVLYCQHGKVCNDTGPALINYDKGGRPCMAIYYKNGERDRVAFYTS